jgi:hypothetical protein
MRTLSIVALLAAVTVFWTGACYALLEIGSPIPYSPQGGFSAGIGYQYHTSGWEYDGGEDLQGESLDGEDLPGDITQNYLYAQARYGFLPGWEVYVNVGAVDSKVAEVMSPPQVDEAVDFEGDYKIFYGAGLRGLIYGTEKYQVGPFFQYNMYSDYEDELAVSTGGQDLTVPVSFVDAYDMNFGLGVNYLVGPVGMLYGGAFAYWVKGTGKFEMPQLVLEYDFKEQGSVGGFLGFRLPLGSGLQLNFEGLYKSNVTASISINKAFGMK